ncbi:hypothetical protein HOK68_00930 [Candidatus Woesearchaeota archaeon]|jgi:hypothetical protein|nr:hypothetical protein [Candidatus Woesearchaeota archaeon]MBT4388058.1 hypothetical protein [Candidatus Woesearchaeota archaeon]MBT4596323.1 hypothetical protein [Candidatus Woesearchaeota archaeon]MBT5740825.1 hypothetical protein [Candidatus Woesearchaeota archaeon]MBT6505325.1 hypothetical protein [Candidatus Woesearchaeota archaeon]
MIEIKTNNQNSDTHFSNNENKTILERAFFGKNNCLKISLNKNKDCYFQFGMKKESSWQWKNVKFSDIELGQLYKFIQKSNYENNNSNNNSISFYHKYNDKSTQIWVNRYNDNIIIKTNDISKSLSEGEQMVLSILIERIILQKSFVW